MKHKLQNLLKHKLQWLALLVALLGVSQGIWADTPLTIYCAVTDSELSNADANTVKANAKVQGNPETWSAATMTKTGATHNGVPVYSGTIQEKYGGVDILQIQLLKGSTWKAQKVACSSWKTSSEISGQIYVYSSGSWETYTPPAPCTTPTASNFTIGTSEYTYDGSSKPVSVTAKYGSPTITVYYTGINGTSYTKSTTAPSAAGRYKVTVNTTAVSTYCAVSDLEVATLKIKKTVTVRVKKQGDYASTTPYLYSWYGTDETKGSGNWPGSAMTLDGTSYKYQITIDAPTYNIIVSKNGSDQTSDIKGLTGDVCYSITSKTATAATATKPTVTTTAAASITTNTATLGGNVTDAGQTSSCGAQTVTARGIEWVSGTGKTAGAKEAASAGGTGSFTVNVTGLTAGTTYTYRAYATNATGTSYGSNKSFTTTTSCSTPTASDITISAPASATTLYLGAGSAPSVTQTVTATCSKGNTYLWSATPTSMSYTSAWGAGTATRAALTSSGSKSTTATFYHEGVYTATFAAGCGNTTDASKPAPAITVIPGKMYLGGPFFAGSGYDLNTVLDINKSNNTFTYEWTAAYTSGDFIASVGSLCNSSATSAYTIANYATLTLTGLTKGSSGNHNLSPNIGTIKVGDRLKLTIQYTGVDASNVPKYNVTLEKVCTAPTAQTVSGTATICTGSSTNVTVASSQSGYTYVLYKDGSATTTTQTGGSALNFSVSEAGAYTVHAYYTSGADAYCKADMSGTATVIVDAASVAGTISGGSSKVCLGNTRTLTLKNYTGSIQWHTGTTSTFTPSASTAISGATSATYKAPINAIGTKYYKAVVTNGVCTAETTATAARITVRRNYQASDFTLSDAAQTYDGSAKAVTVENKNSSGTSTGSGAVTIYYTGTGTTTYAKSTTAPTNAGAYSITIDVATSTASPYYCAATNLSLGADTIKKAEQAALTISNTATDLVYCDAANVKLTTSGGSGDGAVTYTVTSGSGSVDGDILSPSAKGSVSVTATKAASQNFNATTSAAKTFNFNKTAPTVYTLSNVGGATTICGDPSSGAGSGTLRLANSQTGYKYQLYSNGAPIEGYAAKTGTTGSSIDFPVTSSGTYTVYAYYGDNSTNCPTRMDGEITLTISTQPRLVRSAASVTQYMPVTITSVSTDIAEWKITDDTGTPDLSSSTAYLFDQTYDAISFKGASTNGSTAKTYTIQATTAGGCSEKTTITVNPDTESCGG